MKNRTKSTFIRYLKFTGHLVVLLLIYTLETRAQEIPLTLPIDTEKAIITAPHISYDGSKMLFIRELDGKQMLYEATFNETGVIETVTPIEALNFPDSISVLIGAATYNQDASKIYLSLSFDKAAFNIYEMKREAEDFSPPIELPGNINSSTSHEFDPCISPDGKTMYFVRSNELSELSGNYSSRNSLFVCGRLYQSNHTPEGWSRPVLLPRPVNENCERSPRIAADGKTLYFSSLRDGETNDADIMFTKTIGRGVWLTPVAVPMTNTDEDDLFPSVNASGDKLLFLKSKSGRFRAEQTLKTHTPAYDFRPERTVLLKGQITDKETGENIRANIQIQNPNNSIVLSQFENNPQTGHYRIYLPNNEPYKIAVFAQNYSTSYFYTQPSDFGTEGSLTENIELFSKAKLQLNVFDADIAEPLEAEIEVTNPQTQQKIEITPEKIGEGRYELILPLGQNYSIKTSKEYYQAEVLDLDLQGSVQFDRFEKDTELTIATGIFDIQLLDAESGEGIEAEVEIRNLSTGEIITKTVKTDKDGKVRLQLREGEEYEINVSPQGYAFYSVNMSLSDKRDDNKAVAKLEPLSQETTIKLDHILFEFNSADITTSSYEELERVVRFLQNNPEVKIEISAHTDDVGSASYNMLLSERRARSVVEYLTEKGIKQESLVAKGYGQTKPAFFPVDEEENRKRNRRVEMRVLETN